MPRKVLLVAGICLSVVACSGTSNSTPATTSPTSTSTPASTSTSSTSSTLPTATVTPFATVVSPPTQTIPVVRTVGRKTAGPCVGITEVDYCVWGTRPVDKTITNSRIVEFVSTIEQGFTSTSGSMTTVQMEFESRTIGRFMEATEATDPAAVCMQVSIVSHQGLPLSTMAYTHRNADGVRQRITMPVANALMSGTKYALKIQKGPACVVHDLLVMVAMSSQYKYPKKFGTLTIDGRKSIGSLWALID